MESEVYYAALRVRDVAAELGVDLDDESSQVLRDTLLYTIAVAPVGGSRPGAELSPLEGSSLAPRALTEAGAEVRCLWRQLAPVVSHPVARARCWDIVFTLGLERDSRDSGKNAVSAYLDCVGGGLDTHAQANGLLRAWTISRKVRLAESVQLVEQAMTVMVEEALARGEDGFAVVSLLDALAAPPPRGTPRGGGLEVAALLERALTGYEQLEVVKGIAAVTRRPHGGMPLATPPVWMPPAAARSTSCWRWPRLRVIHW
jgi:hypothetical protein